MAFAAGNALEDEAGVEVAASLALGGGGPIDEAEGVERSISGAASLPSAKTSEGVDVPERVTLLAGCSASAEGVDAFGPKGKFGTGCKSPEDHFAKISLFASC